MTQLTFPDLRQHTRNAWTERHNFLGFVVWHPFEDEAQFRAVCRETMVAAAAQLTSVDWARTYALSPEALPPIPWASVISTIVATVVSIVFPPSAPFFPLIQMAVQWIVQVLIDLIQKQFQTGMYGASPDDHFTQVQAWAQQAIQAG